MTASPPTSQDNTEQLARTETLIRAGRFADALRLLRQLLPLLPEDERAPALYLCAVAQRYNKQPDMAMATLTTLLDINPGHARAWQERGHLCLSLNRSDDAAQAYGKASELNPALTASLKALVKLHEHAGQPQAARQARARLNFVERLPPRLKDVLDLIHEDKLFKAERLCRDFLQQHRQHIEGMRMLADIGVRMKRFDDAEFLLESCVEFAPEHLSARVDYLNVLIRKTRFEKAHEQARHLLEREPDNPRFMSSLATTLVGLGRFEEGMARYEEILAEHPEHVELHVQLGHARKTVGQLPEAIQSYQKAYQRKPDYGDAFWSLANIKTYRFTDTELKHIRSYADQSDLAIQERIHFCFAAGKALEDRGEYAASFEHYETGNTLKKKQIGYKSAMTEARVQAQLETCNAELFAKHQGAGHPCRDPIFIVGLPRAGSTLLEQILASHSMVDGTMELHNILALAQRLRGRNAQQNARYPAILNDLDADYFRRFGEQYLKETQVYRAQAPRFIDKMPNNFMHIGLIHLILPEARIIDARRAAMACSFSCFKQLFGEGQEFTYGLREIGHYYRHYTQIMEHWDRLLPGLVLRVRHEDVVNDLETQVRRILDFCELPFEDACLRFHETQRNVRTPSSEQVRQPIYHSGLQQWRHYEPWLEPLKDALGTDLVAQ